MSEPRPPATPPQIPTDATGEWSSATARVTAPTENITLTASGQGTPRGELGIPNPFGRYTITRLLGRGGMGAVFLAHDSQLDRPVAIKIPTFRGTLSARQKERFLREARAVAALRHPNICPVLDVDEEQGMLYLTMAFIDGQTLARKLADGAMEPTSAGKLIRRVARAMHAAHEHGTIHRDLKPANIMIDDSGSPVVMDFGLARKGEADKTNEPAEATTTVVDAGLTQEGAVLGTPAYMPPEQATGDLEAIGPRSDVYSLGAVLYECLTGKRPFEGPDTASVIKKILHAPPPRPREHVDGIDPALEAVCLKALAKRPEDRFESMEAFAAAIQDAIEPKLEFVAPLPSRRDRRPENRKRWISPLGCFALVACLMLTCIGGTTLGVWWLIGRGTDMVKQFKQEERSKAEWDTVSTLWQPPQPNADLQVLFPTSLENGFHRSRNDKAVADEEFGISLAGQRGVYSGPKGEEIEVRAYVCSEAEAKQIQGRVEKFVKTVQQGSATAVGDSKRKSMVYSASNSSHRTVTFGFSDLLNQNHEYGKIWYGQGWLFYFKTTELLLIQSFPSSYLLEMSQRGATAPKDSKQK